jgi:hypothetical protein
MTNGTLAVSGGRLGARSAGFKSTADISTQSPRFAAVMTANSTERRNR